MNQVCWKKAILINSSAQSMIYYLLTNVLNKNTEKIQFYLCGSFLLQCFV